MTFPASAAQGNGQGQGWQQQPVPQQGQVAQPNFNAPPFRGNGNGQAQQQGFQQMPMPGQGGQQQAQQPFQSSMPAQMPQTHQQYDGGSVNLPQPFFAPPQQQQQPQQQYQQPAQQVPNQGWGQQQMPTYVAGQGVPQQQQGFGQPQQQGGAQQVGAGVQFDAQGRMYGPGVPRELQGRTLQEGLQLYGVMQQQVTNGLVRPQQQQQQAAQQQFQQPNQQTPAQQVGAQGQARSFWADPEGAIERIVEQRLAPVTQMTQLQQVQAARDAVAQQVPIFTQYEPLVIAKMQGMSPEILANPQAWRIALEQVVGEQALNGGRFPQQGQQVQQGYVPQGQQPQGGWQPYGQAPAPRLGDFFTEQPSAGFTGNGNPSDGTFGLNGAQQEAARRFGLSNQEYARGLGMNV